MATRTPSRRARDPEGRMPLGAHLRELRNRVVVAAVAVVVLSVVGWFLYSPVLEALTRPLRIAAEAAGREDDVRTNIGTLTGAFDLKVRVSVFIGVLLASPVWLWQLWAFITPGLTRREKRYAIAFVVASVPLFLGGVALAYTALPRASTFLVELTPEGTNNLLDISTYLGFVMRILLAFGIAFLLPVVLVALNVVGVLSAASMLKAWRWVVVVSFAFAAVATPSPDVLSMFFLALPMTALFFVAIGLSALNDRRRARRDREEGYGGLSDDEATPL